MFNSEGRIAIKVSKSILSLFAPLMSLRSLPTLKVLTAEMTCPMEDPRLSSCSATPEREKTTMMKSNMFQPSLK